MKAVKILERTLTAIPIMFGVAIIVFLFMRLTPGDPVDIMMGQGGAVSTGEMEQLRAEFHLDQPLHVQLWLFLKDAVRGDLGYSYIQKLPVIILLAQRLPATIELAAAALLFSLVVCPAHRDHLRDPPELASGPLEHGRRIPGHFDAWFLAGDCLDFNLCCAPELVACTGPGRF